MQPKGLSTAATFVGQVVPLYLCVEMGNVTDDENTFEVAQCWSAEPQIWRRARPQIRCYIEESHISLRYLTSWHLSSRTKMTRATLSKHAVCRQVPETWNIRNFARRKYPSIVANSKWRLDKTLREMYLHQQALVVPRSRHVCWLW
jgi:hypothetical protein